MSKSIKSNATRRNNQLHREPRLTRGEKRELERIARTTVDPVVAFIANTVVRADR